MGSDAKEIYETVLGEIKQELARLVPQYRSSIIESVRWQFDEEIEAGKQQVLRQLSELKQQNEKLEQKITNLTKRIQELEKGTEDEFSGVTVRKEKSPNETKNRINMSRDCIRLFGYKFNGWIYYADDEMGDFLHKVRVDGTDNQRLTDYSATTYDMSVKNGKLYYYDTSFNKHSIDL